MITCPIFFNKSYGFQISTILILLTGITKTSFSQPVSLTNVSADLQSDFQYNDAVSEDSAYGLNVYLNAAYRYSGFEAGIRYEAYQKPMLGFFNTEDQGIPHRYASFQHGHFKVTAGSYYAQFGNGLVLRSYEARGLGFDNALDGIKMEYSIADKIFLTALSGKQRIFFYPRDIYKSTIRGADMNVSLARFFVKDPQLDVHIGGSYASRYFPLWASSLVSDSLPAYVNTYSGRSDINYKDFSIGGEYAVKTKDPSDGNNWSDTIGHALYLTSSYTRTGFGINLQYKEMEDFDFRTDPMTKEYQYAINYLPAFSRQSAFKLFSKYPYQTRKSGERGYQAEINYSPKRGTNFLINYTEIHNLQNKKYYNEIYFEAEKKLGSKNTTTVAYSYTEADVRLMFLPTKEDFVFLNIFALEDVFRINRKHSLRPQVQFLYTEQDTGNWVFAQIEYTFAPHFSLSVLNENNIGGDKKNISSVFVSYIEDNTKFSLSYGKQSAGISCVGGVCRFVPAFSGVTFSVISKL